MEKHTSCKMIVYILRGLPGQGKSTVAQDLGGEVVSADDYFVVDGKYEFDATKLKEAHKYARELFQIHLDNAVEKIVVDNTNTQEWEFKDYKEKALERDYKVIELIVGTRNVDESVERNTHNVPRTVIRKMAKRFDFPEVEEEQQQSSGKYPGLEQGIPYNLALKDWKDENE